KPAPAPPDKASLMELAEAFRSLPDTSFFEFICLEKLGRHQEAEAKRKQFEQSFAALLPKEIDDPIVSMFLGRPSVRGLGQELSDQGKLVGSLLRDLYMAEVFFSVDALEEGERFFSQRMAAA